MPDAVQISQEAECVKQGKVARVLTQRLPRLDNLSLLPKVIKPNRGSQLNDLFGSNGVVDDRFGGSIGLWTARPHSKEQFLPDKVRTPGERKLHWFAEKLGLHLDFVAPPAF